MKSIIGTDTPRFDARTKVKGKEKFAIDCYMEHMLWAGVKRAGIPHGIIKHIDVSEAEKIPGVIKILTGKDVPGTNRQGIIHKDMPVIADSRVRYSGDPVALVLAESKDILKEAIEVIKIDIEPLEAVFDTEQAIKGDAPCVHEENKTGNILVRGTIKTGNSINSFKECDVIIEETFRTPVQAHGFMETENGVACEEKDGTIVMTVSTQAPFRDRFEIAHALGLPVEKIRIISPCLGGGFGGKDGSTVQCLLALSALNSGGRPVKMVWDREESFLGGYKRHRATMYYKVGAKDGTLHSLHCRLYFDTGAYAHLGGEVLELAMEHAGGPYKIPNTLIEGWCVYTNNPVAGAMRAFGVAQVSFAFEAMINRIAEKLSVDVLEFRLKHALKEGDKNCSGITLTHSTGIKECLETIKNHSLWKEKEEWKKKASIFKKRGTGLAAIFNAAGYGKNVRDSAIAKVELTEKGKIRVYNGVSDMGQGNSPTFLQIAGEILSQNTEDMELIQPDTSISHPSGSSTAGRTTYTYGKALIKACEDLKEILINRAGLFLFTDNDSNLRLMPGKVVNKQDGREISLEKLGTYMKDFERICVNHYVAPVCKNIPPSSEGLLFGFPHIIFSYGAHLVYIEIDELTGQIEIKKYLAVTDGGQVINPALYDQQVHGAVTQGLGYAIMEDFIIKNGHILTDNLATYIIPGSMDIPDIISIPVKTDEESGPFGMKGIGEVGINGPLPAVANAIYDACGIYIKEAPFTGEKMLEKRKTL